MPSEVRKAEIVTVTCMKGKPTRESLLEEMEPELEKIYKDLLSTF